MKVELEHITVTEYETIFSKQGLIEEESEVELHPSCLKCKNFFIYDFPESLVHKNRVKLNFDMQAVCTDNYLVYTTPNKVNFLSLKAVDNVKK